MTEFSAWLDGTAARVFALCAMLFVFMNAGAVALLFAKRDRALVNRWTARWLGANIALLGTGIGVPIAAKAVRMTVYAFSASRALPRPAEQEPEQRDVPPPARR